jgi:Kef-type K+ transport system membrane component KefB
MKCCGKTGYLFKLSILGVLFSFILAISGLIYPFNILKVTVPANLFLSMAFILPSMALYYHVKDEFWAQYMKESSK